MTDTTTVKEKIIIAARENVDRNSRRPPAYMAAFQRGAGPLDGAKGGFPWEVPSEQFFQVLKHMDEFCDSFEHQIGQLREGIAELRRVAVLPRPAEDEAVAVTVNVEVEKPEAAMTAEDKRFLASYVPDEDDGANPDGAAVIAQVVKASAPAVVPNNKTEERKQVASVVAAVASAWKCPEHGVFAEGLSRKGRAYRYCPKCGEVDRSAVAG